MSPVRAQGAYGHRSVDRGRPGVAVGDVTGDGKPDAVAVRYGEVVRLRQL
ncbi:hypothetical protein [Micromonospora radicis]|nr:hypothetical protein [Micromonospora radicis]